jgi:hypothetical protein
VSYKNKKIIMTEEFPNPNAQNFEALPAEHIEVTREDIDRAGVEDIWVAIDSYRADINHRMDGATGPVVQRGLEKEYERAELAADWSMKLAESNKKHRDANQDEETFREFIDRNYSEDTHPAVIEQLSKVYDFAHSGAYDKFVGEAISTRRQSQSEVLEVASPEAVAVQAEAPTHDSVSREQAEHQRQAIHQANARSSVEQARGVEVFDDIVRLGKGKTRIYTDKQGRGYTEIGDSGGSANPDQGIATVARMVEQANPRDWRQHVSEAVGFEDITEFNKREVEHVHVEKGRFGRKHETPFTTTEIVPGSEHPKLIRNELTGQDEPAVRLQYQFAVSDGSVRSGEVPGYATANGSRFGNELQVSVELPKSVADKLKEQVRHDPASVRTLIKKLMLENNDGTITEETLRSSSESQMYRLPPYQELPHGWTVAMIKDTKFGLGDPIDQVEGQIERLPISK